MQSVFVSILFCATIGTAFSQSGSSADELFSNFEYIDAIAAYMDRDGKSNLSLEEQENLSYCYYITGNYKEGLPYIDSVMTVDDKRAHFWFWKGTLQKEAEMYKEAKASLVTFMNKTDELNTEVELMIQSCDSLSSWKPIDKYSVSNNGLNNQFSASYSIIDGENIFLRELGLDNSGNLRSVVESDSNFSEILLMRPVMMVDGQLKQLELFNNFPELSIGRIELIKGTNKLVFSASTPLDKDNILQAQQIYFANYTSLNKPIEEIRIWEYSGVSDTSSCSQPAISPDGKTMVFAKSSKRTQRSDLYMSKFEGNTWSQPVALSSLNTFGNEMFPQFQGASTLSFSTDGRAGYGGLDIYTVNVEGGEIGSQVAHFNAPINSSMDDFNFSWQDTLNGTLVSNRYGGRGDDDIWMLSVEMDTIVPVPPIPEKPDGFPEWFAEWNMKPIYFDFDSFETDANADFIDGCIRYQEKYGVNVTLIGHTDSRGLSNYNYKLGLDRSVWLKGQLKNANVFNTIITKSVGEMQLVNDCEEFFPCSEADHRLNRFVRIELTANENASN